MQLLDPVQEPLGAVRALAPRLDTLNGKMLGLYSNEKLNARRLLELVSEDLTRGYAFIVRSGTYHQQFLMEPTEWGDVDGCDAVILANGDCGACSSSGIANAIQLENRGIPTMLISTPPFVDAVRAMAEVSGMRGIEWSVVEHPIGSAGEHELHAKASMAAEHFRTLVLRSGAG
ncbi:MAG: hypothetical protein M0Z30_03885 [Actinomycetota bacterium]|nr:hypothetical protein [Actinomycetota bacterium]